jgi:hypothetical protein
MFFSSFGRFSLPMMKENSFVKMNRKLVICIALLRDLEISDNKTIFLRKLC